MTPILQRVKQATVALALFYEENPRRPFNIVGSGFCVHPGGIVITCEHVLSGFMRKPLSQVISESDTSKDATPALIPVDSAIPYAIFFFMDASTEELIAIPVRAMTAIAKTNHDIGMVRLNAHAAFKSGFPFLEVASYQDVYEGQEIGTCGFPLGSFLQDQIGTVTSSFTKGIVSSIIPTQGAPLQYLKGFQLNLVATKGNSGGPVFMFDSGKVFGVLERGVMGKDNKLVQGLSVAAPIYPAFEHDSINRLLNAKPGHLPTG